MRREETQVLPYEHWNDAKPLRSRQRSAIVNFMNTLAQWAPTGMTKTMTSMSMTDTGIIRLPAAPGVR